MQRFMRNILLIWLALAALAACRGRDRDATTPTPPPVATTAAAAPTADEPVVVQFAVTDFELPTYSGLIETFEEENPGITIRLVSADQILGAPGAADDETNAAFRLAQSADVFTTAAGGDIEPVVNDLRPFIEAADLADDFYPGALVQERDGRMLILPTELAFNLVFYSANAFADAGLSVPAPGWNWREFETAVQALTVRDGDDVTRFGFVETSPLPFIVGRLDRPLIVEGEATARPRYEDDDVRTAFEWYLSLLETDGAFYEAPPSDQEGFFIPERFRIIQEGAAAMWGDFSDNFGFLTREGDIGVLPYPVDDDQARTTPMIVTGLAMSAGAQNPAAAWAWMEFLSSQPAPEIGFGGATTLPARPSVAAASGFWDDIDPALNAALAYAVDHALVVNQTPGYEQIADVFEAVLVDDVPLETALATAQQEAEAAIAAADAALADAEPFVVLPAAGAETATAADTVVFVVAGGAFDLGQYRDLADAFAAANPGVAIEVRAPNLSGETIAFSTIVQGADCFVSAPALDDDAFRSLILPLDPFIEADAEFDRQDFYPALVAQFTRQGELWGLPAELNPTVLEYNRELFDAAGVPYPAAGWTLDQFVDTAIALTAGEGDFKTYGFVPDAFELTTLLTFVERAGATLIDESGDVPTIAFTDPATVDALRWYVNMHTTLGVKPAFTTDPSELQGPTSFIEREGIIDEGRAAMWTTFGPQAGQAAGVGLGNRAAMDIGVAPLPAGTGAGGGFDQASGYFISADTALRRPCWEWITYLSRQPDAVQGLPARISVAESAAYRARVGDERADAYVASIRDTEAGGIFRFFATDSGGWLGPSIFWLGRAHSEAANGERNIEEALAEAQARFDDYRRCVIAGDGLQDGDVQNECLEEVDPTLTFFFGGP